MTRSPSRSPVLVLGILLAGCGSSDPAARATTSASAASSSSAAPSASSPPASAAASASASPASGGPSYGVERERWPGSAAAARTLLTRLPRELFGETRAVHGGEGGDEEGGASATASYGEAASVRVAEEYVTKDTPSGEPEPLRAAQLLAAGFGLVYACAEGSYEGTAPRPAYPGGGPGPAKGPVTEPVWFSCRVDGAEGEEDFTGSALGWTSGRTAWLVVTSGEGDTRTLVRALQDARRAG